MISPSEIDRLRGVLEDVGFTVDVVSADALELRVQVETSLRRLSVVKRPLQLPQWASLVN